MKLKNLSLMTAFLFVISLAVYTQENIRGTDLIAGSDFIKGLDVNGIHKIKLSFKDNKSLSFERNGDQFGLVEHKAYPASTAAINDLIFKIANLQVKEKVASSGEEDDLKQFELDKEGRHYLVEIFNADGARTIAFRVGKSQKGGRYIIKEGTNDVYLTSAPLWLNSSYKGFIETALLKLKKEDITEVQLNADQKVRLSRENGTFKLKRPEGLSAKEEKVEEYLSSFNQIEFEDFYQYNDPKVFGLEFKEARVKLKNDLIYKLELAKSDKEHFLKVSALIEEMPKQFTLSQNDGVDKLQNIESVVKAQGTAQRFNLKKAGWVYKINETLFKKLVKKPDYFLDS